jgi:hypothetical protein
MGVQLYRHRLHCRKRFPKFAARTSTRFFMLSDDHSERRLGRRRLLCRDERLHFVSRFASRAATDSVDLGFNERGDDQAAGQRHDVCDVRADGELG